jgi:hypothetical protein
MRRRGQPWALGGHRQMLKRDIPIGDFREAFNPSRSDKIIGYIIGTMFMVSAIGFFLLMILAPSLEVNALSN